MTCRDSGSSEVALRNEEVNKRRLQGNRNRSGDGPIKITDPAAFNKLMGDMKEKAEKQKKLEDDREEERKRREGANYKTPEERARESEDAKQQARSGEEARCVEDDKFDPEKDYYAILGVDRAASAAQIRSKYKRLALLYHPDKHKSETPEEQAAVEAKFREVAAAFDILLDESQRTVYDKCRDYMESNPGKGLPPLSPEEAAKMASGAAELRKMRRMGPKLGKHPATLRDVEVSLIKLNSGCTRAVQVERRRVDYSGKEYHSSKTFHLVIRKGSREGDRLTFSEEGDETVDTHPGDIIFTLRAKPHPVFRRRQGEDKNLEMFAAAVPAGDVMYVTEIETLKGGKRTILVPTLRAALENGGFGGVWQTKLVGEGLFDGKEPWDAAPGDLIVQLRFPAVLLAERHITCHLHPGSVYLLGSSDEGVPAALLGGIAAEHLKHRAEVRQMASDSANPWPTTKIACINIETSESDAFSSDAVHAVRAVLCLGVPGAVTATASLHLPHRHHHAVLEDSTWALLHDADAIVINMNVSINASSEEREASLAAVLSCLEDTGIAHALWSRHWAGATIIAIGAACSLLGRNGIEEKYWTVLPWYALRAGGGGAGWQDDVCVAAVQGPVNGTAVGVLETSGYVVDTVKGKGNAELIVAPCKEALLGRAGWQGPRGAAAAAVEAGDDFGFFAAFCSPSSSS